MAADVLKMIAIGIYLPILLILCEAASAADVSSASDEQISDIITKMNAAYAKVDNYQADTSVRVFRNGREAESEVFLYTFMKPNHIRIDMKSPSSGAVLIYPDENGKVFVKPGGITSFLRLRLSPGSTLLKASEGQRIDQTDMGLLIRNIGHSLTDKRRGKSKIYGRDGFLVLDVLSDDHFLSGVVTRYQFFVDEKRRLPVRVKEFTPDGVLKREVVFRNLKTSIAIPKDFFRIEREKPGNGQPHR